MRRMCRLLIMIVCLSVVLGATSLACDAREEPPLAPTQAVDPGIAAPGPQPATLTPTSTPKPPATATPTPSPTATPTRQPTATPKPSPTATSTPQPTFTPTRRDLPPRPPRQVAAASPHSWTYDPKPASVVKDGRLVLAKGYGLADVENGDLSANEMNQEVELLRRRCGSLRRNSAASFRLCTSRGHRPRGGHGCLGVEPPACTPRPGPVGLDARWRPGIA